MKVWSNVFPIYEKYEWSAQILGTSQDTSRMDTESGMQGKRSVCAGGEKE
jgi:hypothetical protein